MGYEGRTASSTVPDEAVPRIRAAGGHVTAGVKPRTATVEQLPARKPDGRVVAPEGGNGQVEAETSHDGATEGDGEGAATAVATAPAPEPVALADRVRVAQGATAQDLADKLGVGAADIVKTLFMAGEMVPATHSLSDDAIEPVAVELGRPG